MDDDERIVTLLKSFAAAMHAWELKHAPIIDEAFDKTGGDPAARMEEAQNELRGVFRKYCVDARNPERRGSVPTPPDYHPDFFDILAITVKRKKATAKVRQPALGRMVPSKGGGIVPMLKKIYTYHLRMTQEGWRLEDRREALFEESGEIVNTVL